MGGQKKPPGTVSAELSAARSAAGRKGALAKLSGTAIQTRSQIANLNTSTPTSSIPKSTTPAPRNRRKAKTPVIRIGEQLLHSGVDLSGQTSIIVTDITGNTVEISITEDKAKARDKSLWKAYASAVD